MSYDNELGKRLALAVGAEIRSEVQMLWAERDALKAKLAERERLLLKWLRAARMLHGMEALEDETEAIVGTAWRKP